MIILPSNFEIFRYDLSCRFVNENDASFILHLRTDSTLSKFIHSTKNDIKNQKEWIREYKKREKLGIEYYFIFEKNNIPIGVNRIYNIHGTTFTTGSWLFDRNSPFESPIAASILVREIAFDMLMLEFENGFDGCHKDNKKVLKFNKLVGLKETGRIIDAKGEYVTMSLTKSDFEKNKNKILKLIDLI